MKKLALLFVFFLVTGCSVGQSYKIHDNFNEVKNKSGYQIMVKSGNYTVDKAIYDSAFEEFGKKLPVSKKEPFDGVIKITFSAGKQTYIGTQPGYEASQEVNCWFSGESYLENNENCLKATEIVQGSLLTWQNSLMVITVKDSEKNVFWSADYTYRGGMEMSGFVVNSADTAAKLCVKRLSDRFDYDFKLKERPLTP